jgi:thioredoxin 1
MDKDQFDAQLSQNPRPVVVDVWAPWCMPCRAIAPALNRLGETYSGQVDIWKLNADENPELVKALGIKGIPTLIVFKNEQEVMRHVGAAPQAVLDGLFQAALSGSAPNRQGLGRTDRLLRLAAGISLLAVGWLSGPSLILLAIASVVLFSAVYDRCPIWRAVAPRLAQWLHLPGSSQSQS